MGISDWVRPRPTSPGPQDLLPVLIDRFERKDYPGLMRLINDNADRIRTEFKSWTKVPRAVSQDPAALNRYVTTLFNIASLFEKSGDPSLKECLGGSGPVNPLNKWNEAIERAGQLTDGGGAAQAVTLLREILDQMRGATGTGIDHFRPRVLGRLGAALAKVGDTPEAIRVTREALELCRQSGDEEGVRVYTSNLDAIGSYEIADAAGQHRYRVVFTGPEGRTLTPDELPGPTGHVKWEIRDSGKIDPEARRLHDEGRAAGANGDHDAAIALFTQAAARDPVWPYPIYDRAFAHLLKKEFEAALADYRKVLELAPGGFFMASTAADMLTREASGEFPGGLYAAFSMLEHMPREQQLDIARQLVEQFPSHAPAWELHAQSLVDPAARLEAIERGLAARPDPETRGSLLIQKAVALNALGEHQRALELLEPMTATVGDSRSANAKALVARSIIQSGKRQPAG